MKEYFSSIWNYVDLASFAVFIALYIRIKFYAFETTEQQNNNDILKVFVVLIMFVRI